MWWIKARRAHTLLPASLGVYVLLLTYFEEQTIMLPSVLGGSGHVMLMLFVPVPLVAALLSCLDSRLPAAEASGTRPVHLFDTGLTAALMVVATVLSVLVAWGVESWQLVTAGRNTLFLTGLMLCARPLLGAPAVLAPVAWLMAVALVGFRPGNDPYPWTVLPEPLSAPHAATGAALMFVVGITVQLRTSRKPS